MLASKTETVSELEGQVNNLKSSLEAALVEVEAKQSVLQALEEAKGATEKELAAVQDSLNRVQSRHASDGTDLEAVREEVRALLFLLI